MSEKEISERVAAADILLRWVRPQLIKFRHNLGRLQYSLEPLKGLQWSRSVIIQLGPNRINDLMSIIKDSVLPEKEINYWRRFFFETFFDPSIIFPEFWEVWRGLITQYHLYEVVAFTQWVIIVGLLNDSSIRTPIDLTQLTFGEIHAFDQAHDNKGNLVLLWQSALCWRDENPLAQSDFSLRRERKVGRLIHQLRVDSVQETQIYKDWVKLRILLDLPEDFDSLLPLARVKLLDTKRDRGLLLEEFLKLGSQINILRSVGSSLRCVSSGLNSFASFSALLNKPFFPPSEDLVALWSSTFVPGKTYGNYVGHLKKGCNLVNVTTDWFSPRIRAISKGLRQAKKGTFKFPNFLYSKEIFSIISTLGWERMFSQLIFIAFLFSLRIPSEALILKRAFRDDPISEFAPQDEKALIGVRKFKGVDTLVIKLGWRKNLAGGCILRRVCLCDESSLGRRICPPHRVWPLIRDRTQAGETLFSQYTKNNFNRNLKMILMKLNFPNGHRYTSKAIRRGATQELTETGKMMQVIKGSGAWVGDGFLSYIDLEFDKTLKISRLLISLEDSSSDEEGPRNRAPKLRNKLRNLDFHSGQSKSENPISESEPSVRESDSSSIPETSESS